MKGYVLEREQTDMDIRNHINKGSVYSGDYTAFENAETFRVVSAQQKMGQDW